MKRYFVHALFLSVITYTIYQANDDGSQGEQSRLEGEDSPSEQVKVAKKQASASKIIPCTAKSKIGNLMDVMLTVENQWTYTYFESSSSEFLSDWGEQVYTIKEHRVFGDFRVALTTVQKTSKKTKKAELNIEYRIAKGDKICVESHYGETPWQDVWANVSAKWVKDTFEDAYICWDTAALKDQMEVSCSGAQCTPVQVGRFKHDAGASFGGPAALYSTTYAGFSGHTGDGTGEGKVLTGYRLSTRMPVQEVTVDAVPDSFELFAKSLAAKIRSQGSTIALKDAISEYVTFGINGKINIAPWINKEALEAWEADQNRGGKQLAELLEGQCGFVQADQSQFVLCPLSAAEELQRSSSACGVDVKPTQTRALIQEIDGEWRLTSFLMGGMNDLYQSNLEGAFRPLGHVVTQ